MTQKVFEDKINVIIGRIDEIIKSLKAIKNYRYDSLCTDYYRSLTYKRLDYFAFLNKYYNNPEFLKKRRCN